MFLRICLCVLGECVLVVEEGVVCMCVFFRKRVISLVG